eukprot:TRINITY_DN32345_c0_g2_i1.p1 TRINITY_DN32345_c0_g2~~TRINITY_DN32345_c0_g2_i1.p1  ORF type:complete len:112 (+),score=24.41 TRINITY_DN32345_c0_g2_i1:141-476(+)
MMTPLSLGRCCICLLLLTKLPSAASADSLTETPMQSPGKKLSYQRVDEDVLAKLDMLDEEDEGLQALSDDVWNRYQAPSFKIIRTAPRISGKPLPVAASRVEDSAAITNFV